MFVAKYKTIWTQDLGNDRSPRGAAKALTRAASRLKEMAEVGVRAASPILYRIEVVTVTRKVVDGIPKESIGMVKRFDDRDRSDIDTIEEAVRLLAEFASDLLALGAGREWLVIGHFHVQMTLGTDDRVVAQKYSFGRAAGVWTTHWHPRWHFGAGTLVELVQELRDQADEFERMVQAGIELSDNSCPPEGCFELSTEDPEVADRFGFEEEIWEGDDDFEDDPDEGDASAGFGPEVSFTPTR